MTCLFTGCWHNWIWTGNRADFAFAVNLQICPMWSHFTIAFLHIPCQCFLDLLVCSRWRWQKQQSFAKHRHILQKVVVFINAIYHTQAGRENIVPCGLGTAVGRLSLVAQFNLAVSLLAQVLNQTYMPKKWSQGFWPQILIIPGLDFMKSTILHFCMVVPYITFIQNCEIYYKNSSKAL